MHAFSIAASSLFAYFLESIASIAFLSPDTVARVELNAVLNRSTSSLAALTLKYAAVNFLNGSTAATASFRIINAAVTSPTSMTSFEKNLE